MDDLQELRSRVEAARERLQKSAEEDRKYGLRLNDIAAIVEGSLSGYRADIERLRAQLDQAATESKTLRTENDAARVALIQAREIANSLQTRVNQRENQNETLRRLLLDLLSAIEADQRPALSDVLRKIEAGAKAMIDQQRHDLPVVAEEGALEPEIAAIPVPAVAQPVPLAKFRVTVKRQEPAPVDLGDQNESAASQAANGAEPESVEDIAMVDGEAIVTDPMKDDTAAPESAAIAR